MRILEPRVSNSCSWDTISHTFPVHPVSIDPIHPHHPLQSPRSPGDTSVHSLRVCCCWVSVCSCWILAGRLFIQSWVNSKLIAWVMVQVSYGIVLMTFYHPTKQVNFGPKRRDDVFTALNFAFMLSRALRNLHCSKVFFMQAQLLLYCSQSDTVHSSIYFLSAPFFLVE